MAMHIVSKRVRAALTVVVVSAVGLGCGARGTHLVAPGDMTERVPYLLLDAQVPVCGAAPVTAAVSMRGSVNRIRVDGRFEFARSHDRIRMQSAGGVPPVFLLIAGADQGTVIYRGAFEVSGENTALAQAVFGIPIAVDEISSLLIGCPRPLGGRITGEPLGEDRVKVRFEDAGADTSFRWDRQGMRWVPFSVVRRQPGGRMWRADYEWGRHGRPRRVRLSSVEWNGATGLAFDVTFSLDQWVLNPLLGDATFTIPGDDRRGILTVEGLQLLRPTGAPFLVDP